MVNEKADRKTFEAIMNGTKTTEEATEEAADEVTEETTEE